MYRVSCIDYNSGEEQARTRHIIVEVHRQMPGYQGKQVHSYVTITNSLVKNLKFVITRIPLLH